MWSIERVLTFIEDFQSNACLWDVHHADYKNCIKKSDAIDFLAKMYEICTIEVEKKLAIPKVSFGETIKEL
jgi:hypothetical protein